MAVGVLNNLLLLLHVKYVGEEGGPAVAEGRLALCATCKVVCREPVSCGVEAGQFVQGLVVNLATRPCP